jgi:FtsZ-interacting cell division protein ZipA
MLETAEQLADDLDGELFADPLTPFTDDILLNYQKKITEHVSHYAFT